MLRMLIFLKVWMLGSIIGPVSLLLFIGKP